MDPTEAREACQEVLDTVGSAVIAPRKFFEEVFVGFLAGGHVLIEDVPGTGKTITAQSFADALGLDFNRVQFTPDLLPADITGTNIYREDEADFEFSEGPLFANIVLADEINRAPPKTQAALLEAMEERQVTAEGVTHSLPDPFFVIATQNPVEQEGTFRLPEAQIDRFMVKTSIGYPDNESEMSLLNRREARDSSTPTIETGVDEKTVRDLRQLPEAIDMADDLKQYLIDIVDRTRSHEHVDIGVSPRGLQRLYETARARAVIHGRDYVVPGDIKELSRPVLAHRLVLTTEAEVRSVAKEDVIDQIVDEIEVPEAVGEAAGPAA